MKIGVDYYPEQWGSPFWEKDIEMMILNNILMTCKSAVFKKEPFPQ